MVIVVGGSKSKVGKTTLIRIILNLYPDRFSVVKITPGERFGEGIVEDTGILNVRGKDTYFFLKDGAKRVYWVRGSNDKLEKFINKVMDEISGDVIIEGNAYLKFRSADLIFFVDRENGRAPKEDIEWLLKKAHYKIINCPQDYERKRNTFRVNLLEELKNKNKFKKDLDKILSSFSE